MAGRSRTRRTFSDLYRRLLSVDRSGSVPSTARGVCWTFAVPEMPATRIWSPYEWQHGWRPGGDGRQHRWQGGAGIAADFAARRRCRVRFRGSAHRQKATVGTREDVTERSVRPARVWCRASSCRLRGAPAAVMKSRADPLTTPRRFRIRHESDRCQTRQSTIHLRDMPDPRMKPDQVAVKMLRVGLCATDAEINHGLFGKPPDGEEIPDPRSRELRRRRGRRARA